MSSALQAPHERRHERGDQVIAAEDLEARDLRSDLRHQIQSAAVQRPRPQTLEVRHVLDIDNVWVELLDLRVQDARKVSHASGAGRSFAATGSGRERSSAHLSCMGRQFETSSVASCPSSLRLREYASEVPKLQSSSERCCCS